MSARKQDETLSDYHDRLRADKAAVALASQGTVIWMSSRQGTYKKTAGPIGTVRLTGKQKRAMKHAQAGDK